MEIKFKQWNTLYSSILLLSVLVVDAIRMFYIDLYTDPPHHIDTF